MQDPTISGELVACSSVLVCLRFSRVRCRMKKVAKHLPRSPGGLSLSVLNPSQVQAAHPAPAWRCRLLQVSLLAGCLASEGSASCLLYVLVTLVEKVLERLAAGRWEGGSELWAPSGRRELWFAALNSSCSQHGNETVSAFRFIVVFESYVRNNKSKISFSKVTAGQSVLALHCTLKYFVEVSNLGPVSFKP